MKFWAETIKRALIVGAFIGVAAFLLWGMWLLVRTIIG